MKKNRLVGAALGAMLAVGLLASPASAAGTGSTAAPSPSTAAPTAPPTSAPTAPSAASVAARNDRLTVGLYVDFLHREEGNARTDPGRQYWVTQLNGGASVRSVLEGIENSDEYARTKTKRIYGEYLVRPIDPGAEFWISGIRGDMEPEWVEQNVLASSEYTALQAQTRVNVVDAWYAVILGRAGVNPANTGEESYWAGVAARDGSLAAVRGIWYSPEAIEFRIKTSYVDLLGRTESSVSDNEINYWYDRMIAGRQNLEIDFAGTPGYFENTPATPVAS